MSHGNTNFISASQIRAARALLNWSQEELADISGLSIATIRKLELGYISPRAETTRLIQHAFENERLEFIESDGVRRCPEDIKTYQGKAGYLEFFSDVYQSALKKSGDIVSVCDTEYNLPGLEREQAAYVEMMSALKNKVAVKCLVTDSETSLWAQDYCEYRLISKRYVDSIPFYVYDDRYAALIFESDPYPKIIVIRSPSMADAFRRQFYSMWEKASPLRTLISAQDTPSPKQKK